jgi:hypothetical protein
MQLTDDMGFGGDLQELLGEEPSAGEERAFREAPPPPRDETRFDDIGQDSPDGS